VVSLSPPWGPNILHCSSFLIRIMLSKAILNIYVMYFPPHWPLISMTGDIAPYLAPCTHHLPSIWHSVKYKW
jgi:hypothetical protein